MPTGGWNFIELGAQVPSFTVAPSSIPNNSTVVLTLTGTLTSWVNGTTVMSLSGVAGVAVVSLVVSSSTAALLTITTGNATGVLTITESVTGIAQATTTIILSLMSGRWRLGRVGGGGGTNTRRLRRPMLK